MKKTLLALLFIGVSISYAQTKDVIVRFNGGHGSIIDSISISGKTYYPGSVIHVPNNKTSDVVVYVTWDNNSPGTTELQLYMKNKVVSDKIQFTSTSRKLGSRGTKGTFRDVPLSNLESIVLIDNQ